MDTDFGKEIEQYDLNLNKLTGIEFELYIEQLLFKELDQYRESYREFTSTTTGDRGIDILITYKDKIELFGREYVIEDGKDEENIFIEIKYRSNERINTGEFANSLIPSQYQSKKPKYVMLITNSIVTPLSHYRAHEAGLTQDFEFILIDKYILGKYLLKHKIETKINLPISNDNIYIKYNLDDKFKKNILNEKNQAFDIQYKETLQEIEFFIQIRNLSDSSNIINLNIKNNRDAYDKKDADDEPFQKLDLYPNQILARRFIITNRKNRKMDSIKFNINSDGADGSSSYLTINGPIETTIFNPPFFGEKHKELKRKIVDITNKNEKGILNIIGEAGAGKSKVINESLQDINNGKQIFFKFDKNNNFKKLINLLNKSTLKNKEINKLTDILISNDKYIIVLDDLHNADETFFKELKELENEILNNNQSTFILMGRNDFTVVNHDYIKFLYRIEDNQNSETVEIINWTEKDYLLFIKHVIRGIPKIVIEKIKKLSAMNPFNVIQTIEYLVEENIVMVYNSDFVGITNAHKLGAKNTLPDKVSELITLRLKNIEKEYKVITLFEDLISFVQVYTTFSEIDFINFYQTGQEHVKDRKNLFNILEDRNFIKEINNAESTKNYEFIHENIYLHLLNNIENPEYKVKIGSILLTYYTNKKISNDYKAYLYYIKGEYNNAKDEFSSLLKEIKEKSKNLSSIDFPTNKVKYLKPLSNTLINTGDNVSNIMKVLETEVHINVHLSHLKSAIDTCDRVLNDIRKLKGEENKLIILKLKIKQQKAHAILNLGHVFYAKSLIEDILDEVELFKIKKTSNENEILKDINDLKFDGHDRLQNIYHQLNYKAKFLYHSFITEEIVNDTDDEKQMCLVKSSRVKEHYYTNPSIYLNETIDVTKYSEKHASERHKVHARLNLCIAKLILNQDNFKTIKNIINELKIHLKNSQDNIYTFSITRSYLSLATAYSLLGLDKEENRIFAKEYVNKAEESIIVYGNGFFIWQVHNLKAIIVLNADSKNKKEIRGSFNVAIDYLDNQGLLYIGNKDLLSINFAVITNYLKFLDKEETDKSMFKFFKKLTYNSKNFKSEEKEYLEIKESIEKYDFIFAKEEMKYILKEPNSGYYLALR